MGRNSISSSGNNISNMYNRMSRHSQDIRTLPSGGLLSAKSITRKRLSSIDQGSTSLTPDALKRAGSFQPPQSSLNLR